MLARLGYSRGGYFTFLVLLVGPVILVSPAEYGNKECEETQVDECLKKLQTFLKLTSLPFTSEETELDKMCSDVVAGYNCSARIVRIPNCVSDRAKYLISSFVDMAQFTVIMFCSSGDGEKGYLRQTLLQNSDCIAKQKKTLECCANQSKLPDFPVIQIVERKGSNLVEDPMTACCPVSNYLKCVLPALNDSCGDIAGNLTTRYIRRASGEQLEAVCQKMPNYPDLKEGVCKTPVPVCSGTAVAAALELTALLSCFFVILINCKQSSIL